MLEYGWVKWNKSDKVGCDGAKWKAGGGKGGGCWIAPEEKVNCNVCCVLIRYALGTQGKPAVTILSCILARQLCFEDPSCSSILEIIPRVCGPVPGI